MLPTWHYRKEYLYPIRVRPIAVHYQRMADRKNRGIEKYAALPAAKVVLVQCLFLPYQYRCSVFIHYLLLISA